MRDSLSTILLALTLLVGACLAGPAAQAQLVPASVEFQVSVDNTVDEDFKRRFDPKVAVGPDGDFAVSWVFFPAGFQGRTFAADGTPGEEFVIAPSADERIPATDIAMSEAPEGIFAVVWNGLEPFGSPFRPDTVGQRYAIGGESVGNGLVATEGLETSRFGPAVEIAPDGSLVVAWSGTQADDTSNVFLDIRARRFDADGNALGDIFAINTDTVGPQVSPDIAIAPSGDFLVVWRTASSGVLGLGPSIHARLYDASGDPLTDEFTVNSFVRGTQTQPAVAVGPDGRFLVIWESSQGDGLDQSETSIRGQFLDSDGSPLGREFQVNTTAAGAQENPAIAAGPEGGFVAAWADASRAIRARVFSPDASPLGDDFLVNGFSNGKLDSPSVSVGGGGETVIVWDQEGADPRSLDSSIRGRRFRMQPPAPCADTRFLCLGESGRFRVEIAWDDFDGVSGSAHRVGGAERTTESGFFYFFDPDNWEMLVKVLDGCAVNGHYWVFAAATTNVGYTVTVTDTLTGDQSTYTNALGTAAPAITDVEAFSACP